MNGVATAMIMVPVRGLGVGHSKRAAAVVYGVSPPHAHVRHRLDGSIYSTSIYSLVVVVTRWPRKGVGSMDMYGYANHLAGDHLGGASCAAGHASLLRRLGCGYEIDPISRAVLDEKIREAAR